MLASYLLGSIPFGYLIARYKKIDIRQHGSGNIGATNVFRTMGTNAGLIVFVLDMLKGTVAVYISMLVSLNPWFIILGGFAAVIGHSFSIFLNFTGGRGVATGLGFLLGVAPDVFVFAFLFAVLVIYVTRYVSVASILTAILVTFALIILGRPLPYCLIAVVVTAIIIYRHIPNIKRLMNGTELKIGNRK
ncbi:MAG: glycerol-3-phosphate 1-O-acyltransferase PlsY [Candidatus Margulisbacteria bacterium]|nr:glycerol-3-phosphate 1-O-acyltransferase PlsY [Candidatus Margulisiibacteriota bacterium]